VNGLESEKRLLQEARELLNAGVENLDPPTERRLREIRIRALQAAQEQRPGFLSPRRWVMAGSFAAAALAAVFFLWTSPSPDPLPKTGQVEDLEILTSQERIDFYQNLDFYRWLEKKGAGPGKNGNPS